MMSKETIDTNTYGRSFGSHGSSSTNYQLAGRELLFPGEIRMMDNKKALLMMRSEPPIIDDKYDILSHPNIRFTPDFLLPKRKAPEEYDMRGYMHGQIISPKSKVTVLDPDTFDFDSYKGDIIDITEGEVTSFMRNPNSPKTNIYN
jgi:type IV secretory pathway TraG/TraD family ATPase VirD4